MKWVQKNYGDVILVSPLQLCIVVTDGLPTHQVKR